MRTKLAALLVGSTILAIPALAQTTAPAPSAPAATPAPSPSAPPPAAASSASTPAPSSTPATTAASSGGSVNFVQNRPQDQFRASKLIGSRVYGANDESIGEINDVLMDQSGRIHAVLLGVGGFLGIGEKDVAVPMNALRFMAERPAARATTTTTTTTTTTGNVANPSAPAATTAPAGTTANPSGTTTARTDAAARADDDGVPDYIVLSLTKDQLNTAPKFEDTRR